MKDDLEFQEFEKRVKEELIPKIEKINLFISIVPISEDKVDIKFSVELGLAIMYDKPIIACIRSGTKIPEKLSKVVDKFVELDFEDPNQLNRLADAITEFQQNIGKE